MKILLTNDDGIDAEGLSALREAFSARHEVWVVAPENERSGSSHGITLRDPVRVRRSSERVFSCRGTPVDCVMLSLLGLVPPGIDLLVSGINHGPNLGTDILYSGTASAACQGVLMGVPSIAVSIGAYSPPFDFPAAAAFCERNLDLFAELSDEDHYLNINIPNGADARGRPVVTFPSRRIYRHELATYEASHTDTFYFLGGAVPGSQLEEGSDCSVLSQGLISLSPIAVHPANENAAVRRYQEAPFR